MGEKKSNHYSFFIVKLKSHTPLSSYENPRVSVRARQKLSPTSQRRVLLVRRETVIFPSARLTFHTHCIFLTFSPRYHYVTHYVIVRGRALTRATARGEGLEWDEKKNPELTARRTSRRVAVSRCFLAGPSTDR